MKGRYVIFSFRLGLKQWKNFGDFYEKNKTGILKKEILDKDCENDKDGGGHAVLLIEITEEYFRFLNSWGSDWGDGGTFKVEKANILSLINNNENLVPKYYDIFFYDIELLDEEKNYYTKNNEYIRRLINLFDKLNIKQIKSRINYLYNFTFTCQKCKNTMLKKQVKRNIINGEYYTKCPFCYYSKIAESVEKELFILENLMDDGNIDFDINFQEKYYIEISRVKLHEDFAKNISLNNDSDVCTIGSENPLEQKIDSFFKEDINSIISLKNGIFAVSCSNNILIFEFKNKKINFLIKKP